MFVLEISTRALDPSTSAMLAEEPGSPTRPGSSPTSRRVVWSSGNDVFVDYVDATEGAGPFVVRGTRRELRMLPFFRMVAYGEYRRVG